MGARRGNIAGINALLSLPSLSSPENYYWLLATTNFAIVPVPRLRPKFPEDCMPVLLPLHAALLGEFIGNAPWEEAAVKAAVDVVRILTANDAIRAATINATYRGHCTPLHMATSFDRIPLLLAVLELGADMEAPRLDGHGLILALFASVSHLTRDKLDRWWCVQVDESTDMLSVLQTLLHKYRPLEKDPAVDTQNAQRRRAMIDEADDDGNTALHYAMAYGLKRSAAALVALGAQTNVTNNAGQEPCFPPRGETPTI